MKYFCLSLPSHLLFLLYNLCFPPFSLSDFSGSLSIVMLFSSLLQVAPLVFVHYFSYFIYFI